MPSARAPAFHFPLPTPLANDRVKLIPFDPARHSAAFVAGSGERPQETFQHTPGGPWASADALRAAIETSTEGALAARDPANLLLAIIAVDDVDRSTRSAGPGPGQASGGGDGDEHGDGDGDDDGALAGFATFLDVSPASRSAEIGLVVLPAFQRSRVATNVVGLMLECAFAAAAAAGDEGDEGDEKKDGEETGEGEVERGGEGEGRNGRGRGQGRGSGGLGLVRVTWMCSAANEASARLAERMGFARVGLVPYHYRFARGRRTGKVGNGRALPPGSDPDDVWRDTILYTMSWEGWAAAREKVERAMAGGGSGEPSRDGVLGTQP